MTPLLTPICFVCSWFILASSFAQAQTSPVQHRDGTSGTITHLGDEVGIYSDAHGSSGPVTGLGAPSTPVATPHGETKPNPITTFGTPAPPNQLTAPPVLPMNPNRPLAPQQPSPPLPSGSSPGFHPSGGGRFGR